MFLITLCLCLFSSVVVALPPGSGFLKVVTDKTNYRTDDTITVTVTYADDTTANPPPPMDDTQLNVVVRKCNAILADNCREHVYAEWTTNPVQMITRDPNQPLSTTVQIPIDINWPGDKYFVSIESSKYGKTTTGQTNFGYIYGMTPRFTVAYTSGSLHIIDPKETAEWVFDQTYKVRWGADGMPGGETVGVRVIDTQMNVHEVGSAVQTVAGGELDVTTVANWGVGGISVEVYLGTNHDIKDKHAFALKEPPAYYKINDPNGASGWTAGQEVQVSFEPKNIPADTIISMFLVEPTNNERKTVLAPTENVMASLGSFAFVVPNIAFTSSSWRLIIEGGGVTSESEPFQITGSASLGICNTQKLQKEMYIHDEVDCKKDPFVLIAGNVKITQLRFEWLWCLDDRMRISAHILGPGGARVIRTAKKIGVEPARYLQVLDAAEHGHDFYVEMSNIFREMGEEKHSLTTDIRLFTFNPQEGEGPPGLDLKTGMRFETNDPTCECPYEDEGAMPCLAITPPCIDPTDPRCDTECVENDTRAKCIEDPQPRESQFPIGTDVCSRELEVWVHTTPCQPGDMRLFSIRRTVTKMSVINGQELPGCDKYWLNIRTTQGEGWIISSLVRVCPPMPCTRGLNCPDDQLGSAVTSALSLFAGTCAVVAAI